MQRGGWGGRARESYEPSYEYSYADDSYDPDDSYEPSYELSCELSPIESHHLSTCASPVHHLCMSESVSSAASKVVS